MSKRTSTTQMPAPGSDKAPPAARKPLRAYTVAELAEMDEIELRDLAAAEGVYTAGDRAALLTRLRRARNQCVPELACPVCRADLRAQPGNLAQEVLADGTITRRRTARCTGPRQHTWSLTERRPPAGPVAFRLG